MNATAHTPTATNGSLPCNTMGGNDAIFSGSEVLEFNESAAEENRFSVNIKGRGWLLCILQSAEHLVNVQRANLRRLVACWNACDGIDTELLEGFSPKFLATYPDRVLAERRALEMQNAQLLNRLVSDAGAPVSLLTERTLLAINRYLDAKLVAEQNDMTLRDREEMRSYAVELVTAILIENPVVTGFDKHIEKLAAKKRRQPV